MEEEKAAAYYDELSRKGEGAARFKQGLGFSNSSTSNSNPPPPPPSSSSSFLSNFVKATSDTPEKLQTIRDKLNKKNDSDPPSHRSTHRRRSRSPPRQSRNAHLIPGYHTMTAAERVKARMKHQLHQAAEQDSAKGKGSGWERFQFDKDAPLDDDDDIQAAEDDGGVVKHISQSFRFSAVETRREEQIKSAHDEAMFGASTLPTSTTLETKVDVNDDKKEIRDLDVSTSLLSEKLSNKVLGATVHANFRWFDKLVGETEMVINELMPAPSSVRIIAFG